jgi:hypothetical protein
MNDIHENSINRNGFVIKPTKLFHDWYHYIYPERDERGEWSYSTFYLVPAVENMNDNKLWLEKNYDTVFRYMLDEVAPEEKDWPAKRDLAMFNQWFNIVWCDLVVDLGEAPIIKSKDEPGEEI